MCQNLNGKETNYLIISAVSWVYSWWWAVTRSLFLCVIITYLYSKCLFNKRYFTLVLTLDHHDISRDLALSLLSSVSISLPPSHSFCFPPFQSVSLTYLSLISLSLYLCLSLNRSPSSPPFLSLLFPFPPALFHPLSIALSLIHPSLPISFCPSHCLSQKFSLSPSLSLYTCMVERWEWRAERERGRSFDSFFEI